MGDRSVNFKDVKRFGEDQNETIIDVREPRELQETGVIPGSINVPLGKLEYAFQNLSDEEFKEKFGKPKPKKDASITVSCKMGGRSAKAQTFLRGIGYTNVKNYSGGWMDWEKHTSQN